MHTKVVSEYCRALLRWKKDADFARQSLGKAFDFSLCPEGYEDEGNVEINY